MYRYKNLSDMFITHVARNPDKKYLYFKDKVYSYAEAYEFVLKTAKILRDNGVKSGDRVVIFKGNSDEYIIAYFAVVTLGAVVVPINSFLLGTELAAAMNDCGAEYLITGENFSNAVSVVREFVPSLKTVFSFTDTSFKSTNIMMETVKNNSCMPDVNLEQIASLIYTSGTTGKPKGVILTHGNLLANAKSASEVIGISSDDIMVVLLPIFHSYTFLATVLLPLYEGGASVVIESLLETSKDSYKDMLLNIRPTILCAVPQFYAAMAKKKVTEDMPYRLYISGGAALPLEIINKFKATYCVPIVEGYGLSEASPAVAFNRRDKQKPGTVGVPLPDIQIKVVDADGKIVKNGEAGELCIKGPNVMKGYWNQPDETAKVLKDGWLHTGDVVTIDSDGFITIVDRIKDLIIVKGMNVYPREIEELLYTYDGVASVAVIGVPDKDASDIIMVFIKPEQDVILSEKDIKEFLKKNTAPFKLPKCIYITDDMPMNANGKVMKRILRDRVIAGEYDSN